MPTFDIVLTVSGLPGLTVDSETERFTVVKRAN